MIDNTIFLPGHIITKRAPKATLYTDIGSVTNKNEGHPTLIRDEGLPRKSQPAEPLFLPGYTIPKSAFGA